jgi:hypothetical protein
MNAEYLRSLKWADWVFYTLVDPRVLARQIALSGKGFLPVAFIFPVAAAVFEITSVSLLSVQSEFFFSKITYGWVFLSMLSIFWCMLLALLIDMGVQFSGKQGNIRFHITLINFAQVPLLFILPAVCIFHVLGFAPAVFLVLFYIALSVWSAFIIIYGIAENNALTVGRSCVLYLVPCVVLVVSSILALVAGGALISARIMML